MHHELKILPCYFDAVKRGDKTFEIRDNSDRGFQKGDTITLREYDPSIAPVDSFRYTGMKVDAEITYVTGYAQKDGYVVFSFKELSCTTSSST